MRIMPRVSTAKRSTYDVCECGDVRGDHRGGPCKFNMGDAGHHGFGDCLKFVLCRRAGAAPGRRGK